jgi:hypothetical protein
MNMGMGCFLNGLRVSCFWIKNLRTEDIAFIDVLRYPQTYLYVSFPDPPFHTVIAVFEKSVEDYRDSDAPLPGIMTFAFPGYYRVREFYSPVYDVPGSHHTRPDYRTTLFWDPEISIGLDGKATVSFFTSDKSSVFRVVVEGITETGIPVLATGEFSVEADVDL